MSASGIRNTAKYFLGPLFFAFCGIFRIFACFSCAFRVELYANQNSVVIVKMPLILSTLVGRIGRTLHDTLEHSRYLMIPWVVRSEASRDLAHECDDVNKASTPATKRRASRGSSIDS